MPDAGTPYHLQMPEKCLLPTNAVSTPYQLRIKSVRIGTEEKRGGSLSDVSPLGKWKVER